MTAKRALSIVCAISLASTLVFCAAAPGGRVLVLVGSRNDPYDTALDTLRSELKIAGLGVTVLRSAAGDKSPPQEMEQYKAIAALGPEALSRALAVSPSVPVIAGMVLRTTMAKENASAHLIAATVDVPFETLLDELRSNFRGVSRLGVIRNPSRSDPDAAQLQALGRRHGFTIAVVDCTRIETLLDAYTKLAAESEAVICFPDASLYNSTTIEALILASIRMRAPVVGFSEGFARAGALFSVYPDYEAAGREMAHAVTAALSGKEPRAEWPLRSFHAALNTRVARMTGLKPNVAALKDVTVIQ